MMDATEGVDQSALEKPYLRRNIAPQNANTDEAYQSTYKNITHWDDQTAFISPGTYKILLSHDYAFLRDMIKTGKEYSPTPRPPARSETFREKWVMNTGWMKDQPAEVVEARKMAYEQAVQQNGLSGFEEGLVVQGENGGSGSG